jgi:hypothetical protein
VTGIKKTRGEHHGKKASHVEFPDLHRIGRRIRGVRIHS